MDTLTTIAPTGKKGRGRPPFRSISLTLPAPPSTNALFFNAPSRGRVRTTQYREWAEAAGWEIRAARLGNLPIPAPVAIKIRAGLPKRPRDLGNLEKPLTDCLVDNGIIAGDDNRNVVRLVLTWSAEIEPGKVVVSVHQTTTPQTGYRISLSKRAAAAAPSDISGG